MRVFLVLLGGGRHAQDRLGMLGAGAAPDLRSKRFFITADKLVQMGGYETDSRKLRDQIEQADILAIDDLGAEYGDKSGWFLSLFTALLNERYAEVKRTIITANLTVEKFRATYGERAVDRIGEFLGTVYVCSGKSKAKEDADQAGERRLCASVQRAQRIHHRRDR